MAENAVAALCRLARDVSSTELANIVAPSWPEPVDLNGIPHPVLHGTPLFQRPIERSNALQKSRRDSHRELARLMPLAIEAAVSVQSPISDIREQLRTVKELIVGLLEWETTLIRGPMTAAVFQANQFDADRIEAGVCDLVDHLFTAYRLLEESTIDRKPSGKYEQPQAAPVHSDDFASVNWFGTPFTFTRLQAACIKVLWQHWERGAAAVGEACIQASVESDSPLRTIFQRHPAWKTMVVKSGRSAFRLAEPADPNAE